jgi:exopolysaccharide production protein ExoY
MTLRFQEFPAVEAVSSPTVSSLPRTGSRGPYRRGLKRVFDVCAVTIAVPVVLPLIGALAVAVALKGGQPFYTQDRVGKGGRVFRMWKLRSMVCNADALMQAHLAVDPDARAEWDATQKLKNDPRITRFGRFLRRSSLDELPQLWNVLTGDMSLVGPRPMMVNQRSIYPGTAYYALRPGITGIWQTAGRNRTTFAARADYDAQYEAEVTLKRDLAILWRTVDVVLKATGH